MAQQSNAEANLNYVMLILERATSFTPNYHLVAHEAGMSSANSAQKKFKKIVESAGFSLVNGSVVSPSSTVANPITPMKFKTKEVNTGSATKKRKVEEPEVDSEDDEDNNDGGVKI